MNITITKLQEEIERHVKAAYALVPQEIEMPTRYLERKHLTEAFEREDWRGVCFLLNNSRRCNDFSPELLAENAAAYRKIEQLSCLVFQEKLRQITDEEKQLIGECLNAIANGPFIPNWEFRLLTGLDRHEVAAIAKRWPNFDEQDDGVPLAVGGALNNLVGYPHRKESELSKYLSVSLKQLDEFADKWFASRRYFDRLS